VVKHPAWPIGATFAIFSVVFALAIAFVVTKPPAHEVSTPGGTAVSTQFVLSDKHPLYGSEPIRASQSLDTVRCEFWRLDQRPPTRSICPDSALLASEWFPSLTQSPNTLYVPWRGCSSSWTGSSGYNVEYLQGSRTLVIHCYTAEALLEWRRPIAGVLALPPQGLLLVPTDSLSVGNIRIVEDDRGERRVGSDRSTEFQVATATIS
jgi:hypothetical protein